MKIFHFILLAITLSFCASCDLGTVEPDDSIMGYDYFPYDSGAYVIYEVANKKEGLDTIIEENYFLKEVIGEATTSFDEEVIKLYRYKKTSWEDAWLLDSIWTLRPSKTNIIKVENDVRYLRMTFPIKNNETWDGNASNTIAKDEYLYQVFTEAFAFDTSSFENTITVIHQEKDENNLIDVNWRYEVYAKEIGLIYKYHEVTDTQPGEDPIGNTYIQKIISYGN